MENKNNILMFSVVFLLVGIIIGWLVGTNSKQEHMMCGDKMMDMQGTMDHMMMNIENKNGEEFDQAFLSEMIMHHEGAVSMAEEVLRKSKRPELIKLANEIISAQTTEIDMMRKWQKEW